MTGEVFEYKLYHTASMLNGTFPKDNELRKHVVDGDNWLYCKVLWCKIPVCKIRKCHNYPCKKGVKTNE